MNPKPGANPETARRALDTLKNEVRRKRAQDARLDTAIREASAAGNSLRDIAEVTGLNHQTIANRLAAGQEQ